MARNFWAREEYENGLEIAHDRVAGALTTCPEPQDEMSEERLAALSAVLDAGWESMAAGRFRPAAEAVAELCSEVELLDCFLAGGGRGRILSVFR